jgi:hypothetical protein
LVVVACSLVWALIAVTRKDSKLIFFAIVFIPF